MVVGDQGSVMWLISESVVANCVTLAGSERWAGRGDREQIALRRRSIGRRVVERIVMVNTSPRLL